MIIREFAPADQPGIVKLQEEFMIEFFPEYVHDPRQLEWNADIYDIADCYIKKGGKIWVAEITNDMVGFGGFRLVDAYTAEIKRIRISSGHRGKGIGKSIVKKIEGYCIDNNIHRNVPIDGLFFLAAKTPESPHIHEPQRVPETVRPAAVWDFV